jgi:hypothetical protein
VHAGAVLFALMLTLLPRFHSSLPFQKALKKPTVCRPVQVKSSRNDSRGQEWILL